MLLHLLESGHNEVSESDFQITETGHHHHTQKRKDSEALFSKLIYQEQKSIIK